MCVRQWRVDVMIRILFFAQLRELLHCAELEWPLNESISVDELRNALIQKNPHWASHISNQKILCAVNQSIAKAEHLIQNGDEVAFFPPVTGG